MSKYPKRVPILPTPPASIPDLLARIKKLEEQSACLSILLRAVINVQPAGSIKAELREWLGRLARKA